ncbi:plasmid pRiA4b ORF-3 family protein [Paraburkholderia unamae]|uniref:plasmid pRiA4b ORF-3 family protein n=1 Tax=Paraburkholderia unamae TaxID=219649 RepID=UPI001FCA51A5|nr:plasmid pRiA4b ORF-3 family protein [Paraburkholderia unamae]
MLPEDVSGLPGYADFIEAFSDLTHEEYDPFLEWWNGSFDPAAFEFALTHAQRLSLNATMAPG